MQNVCRAWLVRSARVVLARACCVALAGLRLLREPRHVPRAHMDRAAYSEGPQHARCVPRACLPLLPA